MPKLLIVDDDKFTRNVLETIFDQEPMFAGHDLEVLTAGDGEEGLAMYREHKPRVVILDLLMPKVDGFEMCKALRNEATGDDVKIVVMSGVYRDSAISARMRNEYDAAFFAKPYQLKEMTVHISGLLGSGTGGYPITVIEETKEASLSTGAIAVRPLPAVLFDMLDRRATGRLLLKRGRVSKTVTLTVGHPVGVSSTVRNETLGHFLVDRGIITDAQHRAGIQRAAESEQRMGAALIELGALTPEQLVAGLTAQTRHKLANTLRWPDGSWRFEPHASAVSPTGNALDLVTLVIQGLRDSATFSPLPEHLVGIDRCPLRLNSRGQKLLPVVDQQLQTYFCDRYQDGTTLQALLDGGLDRAEAYRVLDVLLLVGAITVEERAAEATSQPGAPSEHDGNLTVSDLSEHSQMRQLPQVPELDDSLYSTLFDDGEGSVMPIPGADAPLDLEGIPEQLAGADSGFIDVRKMADGGNDGDRETDNARRLLLKEYLRVQGQDHYGVLMLERKAPPAEVSAAVVERRSKFSMDWFARFDLGRDYSKLEEIHAAYDRAFDLLMDEDARHAYDTGEDGTSVDESAAPPLAAELAFSVGLEQLERKQFPDALRKLQAAVDTAPDEAVYRATLGWAHFIAGNRSAIAADAARPHLNHALVINPDHALAHEYKGVITAELGNDDMEARFHLEKALDADPGCAAALEMLEKVWARAGEFRPLERQYRRLVYRVAGRNAELELAFWLKLAALYQTELVDHEHARIAFESAARLAPEDPTIRAALSDLDTGAPDRFYERSEMLRNHWIRDPGNAGPGIELMRVADQAGRPDGAFMAASALVARGLTTPEATETYQRYRPRFVVRAHRELHGELWEKVRHPDDSPEIGALFELMAPALRIALPLELADLEIDETMGVDESVLPPELRKVRAYVAHMLGVQQPRVFLRPDFGHQVHVGAVDPAILLAGDDALAAPERSELTFRLARAMTYMWPGRAIGGSRPSRLLKQAVLAGFTSATPNVTIADPDGMIETIKGHLEQLPSDVLEQIHSLVAQITAESRSLNLSAWARAMARTADRVGLVLCGDLPAAVRFAADSGSEGAENDLVEFAISGAHLSLRSELGLSIDV